MLSRRSFALSVLAALATTGRASAIGIFGARGLWDVLGRAAVIEEGAGAIAYVIVAPGCDHAGEMWEASRPYRAALRFRWLPVFEGIASNRALVAECLEQGTPEAVRRMIGGEASADTSELGLMAADLQETLYQDEMSRLLWETTGKTPGMPTMVFQSARNRCKVIRGSIGIERFGEVVAESWAPPI